MADDSPESSSSSFGRRAQDHIQGSCLEILFMLPHRFSWTRSHFFRSMYNQGNPWRWFKLSCLINHRLCRGAKNWVAGSIATLKVFVHITEKTPTVPILSKPTRFFQIISYFPDGFKTVRIFPDHCQFSGWFQNCPDDSRCKAGLTKWFKAL